MKSIEGKVIFQKMDTKDCVCCEGYHIFGRHIDANVYDFIRENALYPNDMEGKTVRISVEVLD